MKKIHLLPLLTVMMLCFVSSSFAQESNGQTTITIIKKYIDENGVETVEQTTTTTRDGENNTFHFSTDGNNNIELAELNELDVLTGEISKQLEGLEMEFDNDNVFILKNDNVNSFTFDSAAPSCNSKPTPFLGVVTNRSDNGVTITSVVKGSAAEAAGLKAGDEITSFAGTNINNSNSLGCTIKKQKIGDNVTIKYNRNGQSMQTSATLGTKKKTSTSFQWNDKKTEDFMRGFTNNNRTFAYTYKSDYKVDPCKVFIGVYTSTNRHRSGEGLSINGIIDNTPAVEAGLQKGDIITAMDGINVNDHHELLSQRDSHAPGDQFTITYKRDGSYYTVSAEFKSCEEDKPKVEVIQPEVQEPATETPPVFNNANNQLDIELRAFPNPSNRNVNVRFEGDRVPTIVSITDITGKEVYREHIRNFDGYYNEKIDLREAGAAQGTVIISVTQNGKVSSEKVLYIQGRA